MKKDKAKYLIVYGLFPALKLKIQSLINASPWFSVSFDESLNRHLQQCQMDANIRYWDSQRNIAQSTYYDSKFLLRPNADNLTEEIFSAITDLDRSKFLHLAMDGPNTNWLVLDNVDDRQVSDGFNKTLQLGSCTLHILHGAFQTGIKKSSWEISKVLKAIWKILDESPARRDIYLRESPSGKLPLKFCTTRWIEDKPVADRALEIWPSICSTVKYWQSLPASKRPKNKSYNTLVEHCLDVFIPAKLQFFSFVADILQRYLVIFQSDNPLLPFVFDELSLILYRLLRLVYKKKKLDSESLNKLMTESFLQQKENQLEEYLIDIGAATNDTLKNLTIGPEHKRKFRDDCKLIVVEILVKLSERLPTNKSVVVAASSISPINIAKVPLKAEKRFKVLTDNLYSSKFITSAVADNAKFQYDQFLKNEVVLNQEKLLKFDFKTQRVDSFFYEIVGIKDDYKDLWKVMQLVFIATHGQSFTERGFSINKLTSDVNMQDKSLIAQRFIYDAMRGSGHDSATFPITKEIRQSCKKARHREKLFLSSKKVDQVSEHELKRKSKEDEVKEVKRRKLELEESMNTLKKSLYEEAILSAQKQGGKDHATKAASFAKSLKEKETVYEELNVIEKKLEIEYKYFKVTCYR